jgi:hypothetical protein
VVNTPPACRITRKSQVDGMPASRGRSDQLELAVAIMNAGVDLHQAGTLKWCEAKRPWSTSSWKARKQGQLNHDSLLRHVVANQKC